MAVIVKRPRFPVIAMNGEKLTQIYFYSTICSIEPQPEKNTYQSLLSIPLKKKILNSIPLIFYHLTHIPPPCQNNVRPLGMLI